MKILQPNSSNQNSNSAHISRRITGSKVNLLKNPRKTRIRLFPFASRPGKNRQGNNSLASPQETQITVAWAVGEYAEKDENTKARRRKTGQMHFWAMRTPRWRREGGTLRTRLAGSLDRRGARDDFKEGWGCGLM